MRYKCEIEIDLPREEVVKKMDNVDNMYKWQRGLQTHEFIEGEPGKEGSKMKLNYKMGKREVEMIETITKNNFPEHFNAHYDAKNVHNEVNNTFIDLGNGKTKWESENYFKMSGMMKLFALFGSGMFKKQSMKYMVDFKEFAEKGTSVNG